MQRSSPSPSGARILKLHLRRAVAAAVAVWVRAEEWVDLGLVGRAVGVDPATVRLNGYFLSRGSGTHDRGHVSSSLTWGSLLSFFAARALPSGASPAAPLSVHGKTLNPIAPTSPDTTFALGNHSTSFKRKRGLQDPHSPRQKNNRGSDDDDDDDGILCMKRRLCLDDHHHTLKKPKTAESCSSGSAAAGKTLFSYSCIDEHGKKKRPREGEMMVSSISHKRAR